MIGGKNLKEISERAKYLTVKMLLHNTSKVLLKIKIEPVETSKEVQPICIISAIIIIWDKIFSHS